MTNFNDYWKKKAAKRKKGWAAKNERFATDHTTLEQIRSMVFQPIDYDKRGYDVDAFVFSYFKTANPLVVWNQGVFSLSEAALRKALEAEGAEVQSFKMEVSKASIQGQEAPEPKITDYGRYKWGSSCTNKVFDFEKKYHAWLKHVYKVCAEMELITLNYREVTMTIKRYTMPGLAFAYYEVNPCTQLMKSPLLMEETGFSVLNVAFLLMDMAAEWELRQEEFNYYAKNLKIRKMEAATADRIDLEQWKGLSWKEKINEVKTFMEAVIERDCANGALDIHFHHADSISMIELLKRRMIPYFNSNGLQEVHAYIPSDSFNCIAVEYQGCRALLKNLNHKMWFYPFVNHEWSVNSEQSIEFKRLTISAIAEYLKQMPDLWPIEEQ
jgi:hypothetical protein